MRPRLTGAEDVSVVIPVRNGAKFVAAAVDSVLDQTWRPGELIIVDDGSTDGTLAALESYVEHLKIVSLDHGGVSRARNFGAAVASRRWLAFLDADDYWLPHRLERQLQHLKQASSNAQVLWCGLLVADEDLLPLRRMGVPSPERALRNTALLEPPPVSVSQGALVSREAFNDVGGFPECMTHAEDADLVVRLLSRYNGQALDEDLVLYRTHPEQATRDLTAIERGWHQFIDRCFEGHLLPREVQSLRPRAVANMHGSLAGEYAGRGRYRKALQHGLQATRADPRRVGEFVARRLRRSLDARGIGAAPDTSGR